LDDIRAAPAEERRSRHAGVQMFVDPNECIDCGACIPKCPVGAIYVDDEVPPEYHHFIELNARFFLKPD
jgi:ferredoxin